MKLVGQSFCGLARLCKGTARFFVADFRLKGARKNQKTNSNVWENSEAARFRRLLWADEPQELRLSETPYRANYELIAAVERIQRANLSRSPRSRACEPCLIEEWVPFSKEISS